MGVMMAVRIGMLRVFPVLIERQKKNYSSHRQVIPRSHFHVVVAVQKGIDQGDKGQGGNQPIRDCDLFASAR